MNIHMVDLQTSGLMSGDEIGIFDGNLCLGSATIGAEQFIEGSISIPASFNDQMNGVANGYCEGDPIDVKLYRGCQTYKLNVDKLIGKEVFEKNASLFAIVNTNHLTDFEITDYSALFKCFPNPFIHEITMEIQNFRQDVITVEVYNLKGQRIKSLYRGINKGFIIIKWNGSNDSGQRVVPGVYFFKVNGQSRQVIFEGR